MAAYNEQTKMILIGFIAIFFCSIVTDGDKIGVNYGMLGDLPPADQVVTLMKNKNIGKMRIFTANRDALKAFANSGIDVIVGVGNDELQAVSSNPDSAKGWVQDNIVPFQSTTNIKYIAVGNEVLIRNKDKAQYLVPAMTNILNAIRNANLQDKIKVSTTHSSDVYDGYPPSKGVFKGEVKDTMSQILKLLSDNGAPLMANVYPYFGYINNRNNIRLEYSLFKPTPSVVDNGNGLSYRNLFDAMVDTFISAMASSGYPNVPIVITESGWPSAGGDVATVENAQAYNNNLIQHVLRSPGTPRRPGTSIETYIFSMFNENKKTGDATEQHFGLFNPDQSPVYNVNFSP